MSSSKSIVAYLPKFPAQHLAASKSGVLMINSRFFTSYVAVVRIFSAFDPCEISVNAKHTVINPCSESSAYWSKRSVPMVRITPGNIFVFKPAFMVRLGSYAVIAIVNLCEISGSRIYFKWGEIKVRHFSYVICIHCCYWFQYLHRPMSHIPFQRHCIFDEPLAPVSHPVFAVHWCAQTNGVLLIVSIRYSIGFKIGAYSSKGLRTMRQRLKFVWKLYLKSKAFLTVLKH